MENALLKSSLDRLDELFAPSVWSKRFPTPEHVINEHIRFTKTGRVSPIRGATSRILKSKSKKNHF